MKIKNTLHHSSKKPAILKNCVAHLALLILVVFSGSFTRWAQLRAEVSNLALNKTVVCSNALSDSLGCSHVVDGDKSQSWGFSSFDDASKGPWWAYVDLGSEQSISLAIVTEGHSHSNCANFILAYSNDKTTWTDIWTAPNGIANFNAFYEQECAFNTIKARYFRISLSEKNRNESFHEPALLGELQLFAPGFSTSNLALNKSVQSEVTNDRAPSITDGDQKAVWWSDIVYSLPKWVIVDLGSDTLVNRIRLLSTPHFVIKKMNVFVSKDRTNWEQALKDNNGLYYNGSSELWLPKSYSGRYVKIEVTNYETYGQPSTFFEIVELEVYGPGNGLSTTSIISKSIQSNKSNGTNGISGSRNFLFNPMLNPSIKVDLKGREITQMKKANSKF